MSDIQLNFINASNDTNNSQVVIFQKNVAMNFEELAVAWKVIQNCGQGDNHPFEFPFEMSVSATDDQGNFTPQLPAQNGQQFTIAESPSGTMLTYAGPSSNPTQFEVMNELPASAANVNVYKSNHVLATKTGLAPGQNIAFQFKPTIWIGVVSQVQQGEVMNAAIISSINTEISLLDIASADIIMTGGGPGPNSTPFVFSLANVVMA